MKHLTLRSTYSYLLLFALIVPILAACGGQPQGAAPTAGAPAAEATAAPAAEATAAPAAEATAAPAAEATAAPAAEATAAPAAAGNAKPGILRMNVGAENDNNDPQQASFVGEIRWIMMNWLPLMTFDLNMQPIPGAAEKVDISADGKTYTFHLRPNQKYSNGDPLTAKNFEFAWKRLADPTLAGQYQSIACGIIKGYSEYAVTTCPDAAGNTKTITEAQSLDLQALRDGVGVKATDDNTLVIELVNPAPYFLSMAALWIGAPVREEDAENVQDLVTANPEHYIGNGPFILKEHDQGVKAVWEANPNYVLGPIKLKGVEMAFINESQVAFQAYKNGELDILGLAAEDLPAVQSDPQLSKEAVDLPGSCTFYLGYNVRKPPFDNIKVRQAFAQALDRETWVKDILNGLGKPAYSFIPPGFPGYMETDKWKFDPEAARKTLAEAGYPNGQGFPELKLTFSSSARNKVRYEWLANQFKQVFGIEAQLDPVDPTAYTALVKEESTIPQMFILGWCADYPDPQDWLSIVFRTGGISAGRAGWSNKEYDDLTNQADIEQDPQKRMELYNKAHEILIEEQPVSFFWNDAGKELIKPYVKGVKITPLDYFPGFFNLKELDVAP
jgi:oligopeptide transport system substrate-binding protein